MHLLPIVDRELRVSSRRWRTYWGRAFTAGLLVLVGVLLFSVTQRLAMHMVGQIMFIYLSAVAGLSCLFSGPALTADCLSVERREGTLGFLFLTDLRAHDILIGKLAAHALQAVYSLMAALPVLAVPLMMGGVTMGEFLRLALTLLNALFLSLTLGLLASTVFKNAQNSVGWSVISLLVVTVGLPMFALLWAENHRQQPDVLWMLPSPAFAFATSLDLLHSKYAAAFWLSNTIILSLSLASLLTASRILPRIWQDKPPTPKRARVNNFWRDLKFGPPAARHAHRQAALDQNAFFWLAARVKNKPVALWVALVFLAGGWFGLAAYHDRYWLVPETYLGTAAVMLYMFRLLIASEAVRTLGEARAANALELLLCTSLSVPDILRGQWLALKRTLLGPLVVTLLALGLLFLLGLGHSQVRRNPSEWFLLWGCGTIVFVADLFALFYLGGWSAVTAKNIQQATSNVVLRVLLLPWVLFGGTMAVTNLVCEFVLRTNFNPSDNEACLIWFVLALGNALVMAWWARRQLLNRFRLVAMTRYAPPQSVWQKWFKSPSLPPTT